MADVASFAGVSHQTVSRVLNNHPNVRELTRERVLAAIEQLGYRPNPAARALASGRSKSLGVVTLETTLYGPVTTLHGLQQAAQSLGYLVSVITVRSIDRESLQEAVRVLTGQAVEGLALIAPYSAGERALAALPSSTPVVVVEGDLDADAAVVTVDQAAGARLATQHLLSTGASTVFHVAGPDEWTEARARARGWRAVLEEAGAEVPPTLQGDWSAASGYEAGLLLARLSEVSAIFTANDHMALGVLRALHERGRQVPGDVAVAGFDAIPESAYFIPPLTTVRQDFDSLGRAAVKILVDQLGTGVRKREHVVIAPELVVRQSTERSQ